MKKLFSWIKDNFFTKSFLSFVIIGIINTIINTIFVWFVSKCFVWISGREITSTDALYSLSTAISTLVAYVAASLFSYFANAHFTYNQDKKDAKTFLEAALSFALRYGLTWILTFLFGKLFTMWLSNTPLDQEQITTVANLVASIIMIPPFYFMLGFVFKRTKNRIDKNNEDDKENAVNE
ncbi:MAG: GtrA family protein [Gammaproteobacteria bacterium]|nr:GtrA family protein [Gammaproteobacteria bacterium]